MSENDYIHTTITPIHTYLRSSLKSSLRKPSNSKAIQKMIYLRSGVKIVLMKKLSLYIFLGLLFCNVGFAEIITYNCKFPEGGEKFNGQFKFDLELKELLEVGEYDGTLVKAVPEMNTDLFSKFLLPFGKKGLSIDNGYENEISFGIEYAKGTRAYFFINREKSAMIIHIFTYFTLKQKGELFKIMDKKVEENLKNSKHPYDKVIGIVVHHAIENFSENYLGKAVGKCR